jgi:hypothetical protein
MDVRPAFPAHRTGLQENTRAPLHLQRSPFTHSQAMRQLPVFGFGVVSVTTGPVPVSGSYSNWS